MAEQYHADVLNALSFTKAINLSINTARELSTIFHNLQHISKCLSKAACILAGRKHKRIYFVKKLSKRLRPRNTLRKINPSSENLAKGIIKRGNVSRRIQVKKLAFKDKSKIEKPIFQEKLFVRKIITFYTGGIPDCSIASNPLCR